MDSMHCWIELDKGALIRNYRFFVSRLGHERVAPVLKSNAYGHGLPELYEMLKEEKPSWICVNYLFEGVKLRKMGFDGRVLVVGPLLGQELNQAVGAGLDVTIGNEELLSAWISMETKPTAHIKFNSGMCRQGFNPDDSDALGKRLLAHKNHIAGASTHFANVEDVTDSEFAMQQLKYLESVKSCWQGLGFKLMYHAASSASSMIISESHLDLCRVGVSLYGLWPSPLTRLSYAKLYPQLAPLEPVLRWKTRITTLRDLKGGEFVGYGCTFKASRPMKIAVISVGYFEGYPRIAGNDSRSFVLVRSKRCPLVGRICMNMMMIDVSSLEQVRVGDEVTLLGKDGDEVVSADDLAAWSQTINYEVVTCLNPQIPRVVLEGEGG
ncbi:MAG: alanine racemase [Oligoflexales bacterium]|nr:alanine racemase [Oligoflexales bacterium]